MHNCSHMQCVLPFNLARLTSLSLLMIWWCDVSILQLRKLRYQVYITYSMFHRDLGTQYRYCGSKYRFSTTVSCQHQKETHRGHYITKYKHRNCRGYRELRFTQSHIYKHLTGFISNMEDRDILSYWTSRFTAALKINKACSFNNCATF